jgi:hypothetical protein
MTPWVTVTTLRLLRDSDTMVADVPLLGVIARSARVDRPSDIRAAHDAGSRQWTSTRCQPLVHPIEVVDGLQHCPKV